MDLPSGDQTALRSWTPEVLVRLRVGPCWAGTVNTSPRAPKTARLPSGEIPYSLTFPLTLNEARPRFDHVFRDAHRHFHGFFRRQVEAIDPAAVFKDDGLVA